MMICIVFYKITKMALALWLAERHNCTRIGIPGGLAARSGTEFTWLPQLRNLAEWDWVPTVLQNKYGWENTDMEGSWVFARFQVFPCSSIKKRFSWTFFNGICEHQEAWCMNSSWVTSLIVTQHLGKFSYFLASWIFERPACSITYIFPLRVVLRLSSLS